MIRIQKSPTADSRACDVATVTREQLLQSSVAHIGDVAAGLAWFAGKLGEAAMRHDVDKCSDLDGFYANFQHQFAEGHRDWLDRHVRRNRHHLNDHVPDDVNLIDVLDMIVDCTMAGMARSGTVHPITIDPAVLMAAFRNTCALLQAQVTVVDEA